MAGLCMKEFKFIETKIENQIAVIYLVRTKNLNSINLDFAEEITAVIDEMNNREDVRAVIISSAARIFCSGLDIKDFFDLGLLSGEAKSALFFKEKVQIIFDSCNSLEKCRKPIIAAIHGMCIGAGLDLICACDIRLCTEDATFSLKETALGFVADMGVLQRLPHIIGQGFTREMAYTARFYTAKEAERMGLVNAVYPDLEQLMEGAKILAAQISDNAPLAIMATKEVLNYSRTSSIDDGMDMAIQKNGILLGSKDMREAEIAFIEKRKPIFKGE
jgi:enoyl-CoA hydratase